MSTFWARPLPRARYCIGLLALVALSLVPALAGAAAQPASAPDAVNQLNGARARAEVQPLSGHPELDGLAADYLDAILASRSLSPPGYGRLNARVLSEDVVSALGEDGPSYRYVGVVVSYGVNLSNAVHIAANAPANGPALLEPALSIVGIAAATVPAPSGSEDLWFAAPPGGGLDVELTGQTVVVIVTAGQYRSVT